MQAAKLELETCLVLADLKLQNIHKARRVLMSHSKSSPLDTNTYWNLQRQQPGECMRCASGNDIRTSSLVDCHWVARIQEF